MTHPVLSVLIVTWNCRDLIGRCLDHLFASIDAPPFEVVVVDNASSDGTPDVIRARSGPIRLIESPENLGFGRGNNLAASHATGDYLLLLNPDAFLTDPRALAALFKGLREGEGLAAVGPRLVNPDGSHQVGDGGHAPTLPNVIRHQWFVSRLIPGMKGFYINHPALLRRERVAADWLAATCLLVDHAAFDAVGGFDPRFFMYGEDVDLGLRLGKSGRSLALLPQIRVVHLQGATQRTDPQAVHVSFGWIDAVFALHQEHGLAARARRQVLAGAMAAGFAVRAIAYRLRGAGPRAAAMTRYARHSWRSR